MVKSKKRTGASYTPVNEVNELQGKYLHRWGITIPQKTESDEKKIKDFEGEGLGFAPIFGFMLSSYAELGISRNEFLLLLHIGFFHYEMEKGESSRSLSALASLMGYKNDQMVHRMVEQLRSRGFLNTTERNHDTYIFDVSPFAEKALALWKSKRDSLLPSPVEDIPEYTNEDTTVYQGGISQYTRGVYLSIPEEREVKEKEKENAIKHSLSPSNIYEEIEKGGILEYTPSLQPVGAFSAPTAQLQDIITAPSLTRPRHMRNQPVPIEDIDPEDKPHTDSTTVATLEANILLERLCEDSQLSSLITDEDFNKAVFAHIYYDAPNALPRYCEQHNLHYPAVASNIEHFARLLQAASKNEQIQVYRDTTRPQWIRNLVAASDKPTDEECESFLRLCDAKNLNELRVMLDCEEAPWKRDILEEFIDYDAPDDDEPDTSLYLDDELDDQEEEAF